MNNLAGTAQPPEEAATAYIATENPIPEPLPPSTETDGSAQAIASYGATKGGEVQDRDADEGDQQAETAAFTEQVAQEKAVEDELDAEYWDAAGMARLSAASVVRRPEHYHPASYQPRKPSA